MVQSCRQRKSLTRFVSFTRLSAWCAWRWLLGINSKEFKGGNKSEEKKPYRCRLLFDLVRVSGIRIVVVVFPRCHSLAWKRRLNPEWKNSFVNLEEFSIVDVELLSREKVADLFTHIGWRRIDSIRIARPFFFPPFFSRLYEKSPKWI